MEINNTLDSGKIEKTIGILAKRIHERFPDSSLGRTCDDFYGFSKKSKVNIDWIDKPFILIRIVTYLVIALTILLVIYSITLVDFKIKNTFSEIATVAEASINNIVLLSAAFFFLFTIENRLKRKRAIKFLNEIRGFAHVVDMHQLIKDPQRIDENRIDTENSPKRELTKFEMQRYLDYCSEFLSLIGKVAALYSQSLPDVEVVQASSEVENLCANITNKVWQKLVILNQ